MDIVGAAETGSGKTLAFGIPIVQGILQDRRREKKAGDEEDDEDRETESLHEVGPEGSPDNAEETEKKGG